MVNNKLLEYIGILRIYISIVFPKKIDDSAVVISDESDIVICYVQGLLPFLSQVFRCVRVFAPVFVHKVLFVRFMEFVV